MSNDLIYTIEDISNIGKFYFVSNKNPWEDVKIIWYWSNGKLCDLNSMTITQKKRSKMF